MVHAVHSSYSNPAGYTLSAVAAQYTLPRPLNTDKPTDERRPARRLRMGLFRFVLGGQGVDHNTERATGDRVAKRTTPERASGQNYRL